MKEKQMPWEEGTAKHLIINSRAVKELVERMHCPDCKGVPMTQVERRGFGGEGGPPPLATCHVKGGTQVGLATTIVIECYLCHKTTKHDFCPECEGEEGAAPADINFQAAVGMAKIGKGHEALRYLLAALDLPKYSRRQWNKSMALLRQVDKALVGEAVMANLKEEIQKQQQHLVEVDNMWDYITEARDLVRGLSPVQAAFDGNWVTRGYHSNHGFACFVGRHSKKIIATAWKSKVCPSCKPEAEPGGHDDCKKNHVGSSSSMEPACFVDMVAYLKEKGAYVLSYCADGDTKIGTAIDTRVVPPPTADGKGGLGLPRPVRVQDKNHAVKVAGKGLGQLQAAGFKGKGRALSPNKIMYITKRVGSLIKQHCFIHNGERVTRDDVERKAEELCLAIKHAAQHWCEDHTDCGQTCNPSEGRQVGEKPKTGMPNGYLDGGLVATQVREGASLRQLSGIKNLLVEGGKTLKELLIAYLESVFTSHLCKQLLQPGFGSNVVESVWSCMYLTQTTKNTLHRRDFDLRFDSTVLSKTYGRPFALQKTLERSGVAVSGYTCAHLEELQERRQSEITRRQTFVVKERRVLAKVRRVAEAPLEGGGEEGGECGPPMRKKRTRKEKDRHSAGSDFSGEGGEGGGEGGGGGRRRTRKQSCCSVCNEAGHYAKTVDGCKICPKTNTPTAVDDVDSSSSSDREVEGNHVHAPPRHQPMAHPFHPPAPPPSIRTRPSSPTPCICTRPSSPSPCPSSSSPLPSPTPHVCPRAPAPSSSLLTPSSSPQHYCTW